MKNQEQVARKVVLGEDDLKTMIAAAMDMGEARGFYKIEKLSRFAKIKLLAEINETGAYKAIPGYTMRDVFKALGISKSNAYKELETFAAFGEKAFEVLCSMGFGSHKMNLLAAGDLEIEEVEFEIVEPGVIRYDGRRISLEKNPREFEAAMLQLREQERVQRQARLGLQKKLEDEQRKTGKLAAENERKDHKIAEGEKQLRDAEKPLPGETEISKAIFEIAQAVKQILAMDMTEEDEERREFYIQRIGNTISSPLVAKFNPRGEDMLDWADETAGLNEFKQVKGGRV